MKKYNIVVKEQPLDVGLAREELLEMLDLNTGEHFSFIEVDAENAIGVTAIDFDILDREFDYDPCKIKDFVESILTDNVHQNEDMAYTLRGKYNPVSVYVYW